MLELILIFAPVLALVIWANVLTRLSRGRRLFEIVLALLHLALLGLGGLLLLGGAVGMSELDSNGLVRAADIRGFGAALVTAGLWGILALIPPLRRSLARRLRFDAQSPTHTLALVMAGYLLASAVLSQVRGGLDALADDIVAIPLSEALAQQVFFGALGLLGVGLFVRRGPTAVRERLGLTTLTRREWLEAPVWIVLLVLLQAGAGLLLTRLTPEDAALLESISATLFSDVDALGEALLLTLVVGFSEEILFRGALQPIFGLVPTTVLFTLVHVQYGFTLVTILVFVLGFALAWIRHTRSTTLAIVVHFGYDFVLFGLSLLAPQLS